MNSSLLWIGLGLFVGCSGAERTESSAQNIVNGYDDSDNPVANATVQLNGGCTGTLITSRWILTAAHCVSSGGTTGGQTSAFVGKTNVDGSGNPINVPGMPNTYAIDTCYRHPLAFPAPTDGSSPSSCSRSFDPGAVDSHYDLALVRLSTPVPRASARPTPVSISDPLALSEPNSSSFAAWVNQIVHPIGWGATGTAPGTTIRQRGNSMLQYWELVSGGLELSQATGFTFADGAAGASLGGGDSGGPLLWSPTFVTSPSRERVVGVNSRSVALWTSTMGSANGAWINNVLTGASADSTTGSTTPPSTGWLGEGGDASDNCPNLFNPWQDDDDNDGIGNECDTDGIGSRPNAVTAYIQANGDTSTIRTVSNHVRQIYLNATGWHYADLSVLSGIPTQPAAGAFYSAMRRTDGVDTIVFRSSDGNISQIYFSANQWHYANMMASTCNGAPQPSSSSNPLAFVRHDSTNSIYYATSDGHIHEISLAPGSTCWIHADVSQVFPSTLVQAGTNMSAFVRSDQKSALVYLGTDGHIHMYVLSGGTWTNRDLTVDAAAGGDGTAIAAASTASPFGYVRADGVNSIVYRGADNHVREITISSNGLTFAHWDVNLHGGGQNALTDPMGFRRSDNSTSIVYRAANDVRELRLQSGSWSNALITSSPTSTTNPPHGYVRRDLTNTVLSQDSSNLHLRESAYASGAWSSADLSAFTSEM